MTPESAVGGMMYLLSSYMTLALSPLRAKYLVGIEYRTYYQLEDITLE